MKGEFSEKTKVRLAKRAGEKCSICQKSTSKPNPYDLSAFINLGEAAHIKGHKEGKHLRYDPSMSDNDRSHISNGMWLCSICHKEVDSDSLKYPVEVLTEIKRIHENKVYLGEFDIFWEKQVFLERRISDLEAIISEKDKNSQLQDLVHNAQLNEIKIELEKVREEKTHFERTLESLKGAVANLNLESPSSNTKAILQAYLNGDIEKVKEALQDSNIEKEEFELAQKRLIKATILELEKHYEGALLNYEKAALISPKIEVLTYYIVFLKRKRLIRQAINVCKERLINEVDINNQIFLNSSIGELYCEGNNSMSAIPYFLKSKASLDKLIADNPEISRLRRAVILTALGNANKNIGEFDKALAFYEQSLNEFWSMSVQDGITHVKELGILFNGIGLIYMDNNKPADALFHFEKARNAFEETKDLFSNSILCLNIADLYHHYKMYDLGKARKYIEISKEYLLAKFSKSPLQHFKYYLGALIKSADNYLRSGNLKVAEKEYSKAISIGEEFYYNHKVSSNEDLAILYTNYSVFAFLTGNKSKAKDYNEKGIQHFLTFDTSEHDKNFNLAKSYLFNSELADNENEKKESLLKASNYINLCSDKTLAKAWKLRIDAAKLAHSV